MTANVWALDSSVFINFVTIEKLPTLASFRNPIAMSEYVYRTELTGPRASPGTRTAALNSKTKGHFELVTLTLADLANLGALARPRRVGLGEASCAIIAANSSGGVLCDDMRSKAWLTDHFSVVAWERTEEILVAATHAAHLDEYALAECQKKLEANRYKCYCDLRTEFLQQRLARRP
jgi:hypothetical protein